MANMPPGAPPPKLYKYRSMNTELEREWVRDILLNNRLFIPTRLNFNDPFDCRIPLTWEGVIPGELKRKMLDIYTRNAPKGLKKAVKKQVKKLSEAGCFAEYV
jgi:hypothetical protein